MASGLKRAIYILSTSAIHVMKNGACLFVELQSWKLRAFVKFQSWKWAGFCENAHESVFGINKFYPCPNFDQI